MEQTNQIFSEEVVKLLTVWLKRGTGQVTLIKELDSVGFKPKRIAELLGTTPNTVNVALHAIRKNKKK